MRSPKDTFFHAALTSENKAREAEQDAATAFARGDMSGHRFLTLLAQNHRKNADEQLIHASNYDAYDRRAAAGLAS